MAGRTVRVKVGERWYTVEVEDLSASPVRVTVDGQAFDVELEGLPGPSTAPRTEVPQAAQPAISAPPPAAVSAQSSPSPPGTSPDKVIRSPMPGKVLAIMVRPGDTVEPEQEVCVVEAMKMEQSIRTQQGGVVKTIHVQPMQQVAANALLMELE